VGLIYCATFKNNKVYIGQTKQKLNDRIAQHKFYAEHYMDNFLFHKAIRKYGINSIQWEVLEDNINDISTLNEREKYWIEYKQSFFQYGKGYNMTLGGDNYDHKYKFTLEECQQLLEDYKKIGNSSIIANDYNATSSVILRNIRRVDPEWKKYSNEGKYREESYNRDIFNYYILTGSVSRVSEQFNIPIRTISRILSNIDRDYYKKYRWNFYNVNKEDAIEIYEDFQKIGSLDILSEKYSVGKETIRGILLYFDKDYSKYTQKRKRSHN